jgi:nicotinamidase-related amidase
MDISKLMKHVLHLIVTVLLIASCAGPQPGSEQTLVMHTRTRFESGEMNRVVEETVRWNPHRTALIVCDMWDAHWCSGAANRVAELAGPMNDMLEDARALGILVIHAPSSVVDHYEATEERSRAQRAPHSDTPVPLSDAERWGTSWCWPVPEREPDLPIDDSDMGCDCDPECDLSDPWTRQIEALRIDSEDAITDDGQETWNLLELNDIEHVILCGVHLNMCVLGRPFGIRQMVMLGKDVVLLRDMTDSMYDRDQPPLVDHFTGTDLVVGHIERFWCPSALSTDITNRPAFRFREDLRP